MDIVGMGAVLMQMVEKHVVDDCPPQQSGSDRRAAS